MDEALGTEASEEALDEAVLQVQMHVGRIQRPLVREHDWPDRLLFAPFPDRLPCAACGARKRVERVHPGRIGVRRGSDRSGRTNSPVLPGRLQGLGAHELQAAGNRLPQIALVEAQPLSDFSSRS